MRSASLQSPGSWRPRSCCSLRSADGTVLVYALGGWAPPFGIVLVADRLAATLLVLTGIVACASLLYAVARDTGASAPRFHALFQFQLLGIQGAFLTGDLFNLFVFFEVLLIASYALLLHGLTAGSGQGGAARRGAQPDRFRALPAGRRTDLRRGRHAQLRGPRPSHPCADERRRAARADWRAAVARRVRAEVRTVAARLLVAACLRRGRGRGRRALRRAHQGRRVRGAQGLSAGVRSAGRRAGQRRRRPGYCRSRWRHWPSVRWASLQRDRCGSSRAGSCCTPSARCWWPSRCSPKPATPRRSTTRCTRRSRARRCSWSSTWSLATARPPGIASTPPMRCRTARCSGRFSSSRP